MKLPLLPAVLLAATATFSIAADPAPAPEGRAQSVLKEIQAQQAQLVDNQAKIEAKLAAISEAVRLARIYSSRSGH